VFTYGLSDTAGLAVSTPTGRKLLQQMLQEALERFEPRLADPRVRLVDLYSGAMPQVRFTIEATLRMDPSPERVVVRHGARDGEWRVRRRRRRPFSLTEDPRGCRTICCCTTSASSRICAAWARSSPRATPRWRRGSSSSRASARTRTSSACWRASRSSRRACSCASTRTCRRSPRRCSTCCTRSTCGRCHRCRSVELELDQELGKLPGGFFVPRGSELRSKLVQGLPCRFRTSYDVTLWPASIAAAEWTAADRVGGGVRLGEAVGAVRVELRAFGTLRLGQLTVKPRGGAGDPGAPGLDALRLHLPGGERGGRAPRAAAQQLPARRRARSRPARPRAGDAPARAR
jgi:hypothetical protein